MGSFRGWSRLPTICLLSSEFFPRVGQRHCHRCTSHPTVLCTVRKAQIARWNQAGARVGHFRILRTASQNASVIGSPPSTTRSVSSFEGQCAWLAARHVTFLHPQPPPAPRIASPVRQNMVGQFQCGPSVAPDPVSVSYLDVAGAKPKGPPPALATGSLRKPPLFSRPWKSIRKGLILFDYTCVDQTNHSKLVP